MTTEELVPCPTCHGTTEMDCPVCHGSGERSAPPLLRAQGVNTVPCPEKVPCRNPKCENGYVVRRIWRHSP